MVFVFVARIRRFERIGAGVDLQQDVDDVLQGHFVDAWTDIDAVAGMEANLLGGDAADRVIDGFDALCRPLPALFDAEFRVHHIIADQARIIDLENESSIDDRLVFFVSRAGYGLLCLLVGTIVLVGKGRRDVRRSDRGHKDILVNLAPHCRLEVIDVLLDRLVAPVADRPGADIDAALPAPSAASAKRFGDALGPRIVVGKREIFPARRPWSALLTRSGRLTLEAAESLDDVAEEARFALLAVGDDVDARFDLPPHHVRYRLAHQACELFAVVGLTLFPESKERDQGVGAGQATHMGGEDSFCAVLHRLSFLRTPGPQQTQGASPQLVFENL